METIERRRYGRKGRLISGRPAAVLKMFIKFSSLVVFLVFGLFCPVVGQVDCVVENKVFVRDYDGNIIKNANVEICEIQGNFRKVFAFKPQKIEDNVHLIISTMGRFHTASDQMFYVAKRYWLKVSASDFKVSEQSVQFDRCLAKEIVVRLERENQKIKLTGIVYDINGSVVVRATVTAISLNKEQLQGFTNDEGKYVMKLLPGTYRLEFWQGGFERTVLRRYLVVNSTFGNMSQDIVLTSAGPQQ